VVITLAESDLDVQSCFAAMSQLRPHLQAETFLSKIRQQARGGYRLVRLVDDEVVRAVAGYRLIDNLAGGRVLYVDDLVTDAAARSRGYGKALLNWLIDEARRESCGFLELDSGVQRFDAHRFYLSNRMIIASHHFRLAL
jgi:GNAT superfamily N-acetyltransferase